MSARKGLSDVEKAEEDEAGEKESPVEQTEGQKLSKQRTVSQCSGLRKSNGNKSEQKSQLLARNLVDDDELRIL